MFTQPKRSFARAGKCVLWVAACLLTINPAIAQQESQPQITENQLTVDGCLHKIDGTFYLSAAGDQRYRLIGETLELSKYHDGEAVTVQGITGKISELYSTYSRDPYRDLRIVSASKYRMPIPALSSPFRDVSRWRTDKNTEYGIQFA